MPPYSDYHETCLHDCCRPELTYRPADIHNSSAIYHRTHAKVDQLSAWNTPATIRALRDKRGSWGYLTPYNHIVFDETGHLWIREDAELRPAPKNVIVDFDKTSKALVFWTATNNIGVYLHTNAFHDVQLRSVSSLKTHEATSNTGVVWTPVAKVVNEVPTGLNGFPY